MTKSLLLKGIAGVAAVGGTVGGGYFAFNKGLFGGKGAGDGKPKKVIEISKDVKDFTQKELIDKVGLDCKLEGNELSESETKECNVKTDGTLSIKIENSREDGVTFSSSSGSAKLKVSKAKSRSEKVGARK